MSLFSIIATAVAIPLGIAFSAFIWFYFRLRLNATESEAAQYIATGGIQSQPSPSTTEDLPVFQPITAFMTQPAEPFTIEYDAIDAQVNPIAS